MRKNIQYRRVVGRITLRDFQRLERVRKAYRFRSSYEIMQYLIHCFLRVADPDNDQQYDPLPKAIVQMFNLSAIQRFIQSKKNDKQLELFDEDEEKKDEVDEMFDTYSNAQSPEYVKPKRALPAETVNKL